MKMVLASTFVVVLTVAMALAAMYALVITTEYVTAIQSTPSRIAAIGAAARFVPTSAPVRIRVRVPVLRRPSLVAEAVASESPPS